MIPLPICYLPSSYHHEKWHSGRRFISYSLEWTLPMINEMLIRTVLQSGICLVPFISGRGYFLVLYIIKDWVENFMCTILKLRETLSQHRRVLIPDYIFQSIYHIVLSSHHSLISSLPWPIAQLHFNSRTLACFFFLTFPTYTKVATLV